MLFNSFARALSGSRLAIYSDDMLLMSLLRGIAVTFSTHLGILSVSRPYSLTSLTVYSLSSKMNTLDTVTKRTSNLLVS